MRSLKNQVTLLVMGIIALVTMIVILVFYLQARPILLMNTETEAKRDIAAAEAIIDLKHPGPGIQEEESFTKVRLKLIIIIFW